MTTIIAAGRHRATIDRPARVVTVKPVHRRAVQPTFTPWRILFLILIFPATVIAVAVGIYFAPNGDQLFHSTVRTGELPVVQWQLAPGAQIR